MSIIRENYQEINDRFEKHKSNIPNGLLIEIYDSEEERNFFINELGKLTKKLYDLYSNDNEIKIEKNKKFKLSNLLSFLRQKKYI